MYTVCAVSSVFCSVVTCNRLCTQAECLADTNCDWRKEGAMTGIIRKILKALRDAALVRITLKDFVALSKKYPSTLFLPLFGLMEQIFDVVAFEETKK